MEKDSFLTCAKFWGDRCMVYGLVASGRLSICVCFFFSFLFFFYNITLL